MAQFHLVALLASRLSLATLIAIVMILWIVMTAQMVSDVNRQEAEHKKMMRERPHQMPESDPRIFSRIRGKNKVSLEIRRMEQVISHFLNVTT